MHLNHINYEQQYQLIGPSGTVVWYGTIIFGQAIKVASTEASADILAGAAVLIDGPNSTFGRDANLSTNDPDVLLISGVNVVSAASVGFIGVAAETINAAKVGTVAGDGSLCTVRVTSGAIAVGAAIGGSATAALCASIAGTTSGTVLGQCIKAAAQIGTSGLYTAGIAVGWGVQ